MTDFNRQANTYARYRPVYPQAVGEKLASLVKYRGVCWDVGTGTGQMALQMADHFNLVCASDIGEKSLELAPGHNGILYSLQPAEKTDYPDDFFDLIVAAQAAHWFNLEAFYAEVKRVAKREGAIAIIGYARPVMPEPIQKIYDRIEFDLLKGFWDKRVDLLGDGYKTIPFPFYEIPLQLDDLSCNWTAEQLTGFLSSWSAVQNLDAAGRMNDFEKLVAELKNAWPEGDGSIEIRFPLVCRAGYVFEEGQGINL